MMLPNLTAYARLVGLTPASTGEKVTGADSVRDSVTPSTLFTHTLDHVMTGTTTIRVGIERYNNGPNNDQNFLKSVNFMVSAGRIDSPALVTKFLTSDGNTNLPTSLRFNANSNGVKRDWWTVNWNLANAFPRYTTLSDNSENLNVSFQLCGVNSNNPDALGVCLPKETKGLPTIEGLIVGGLRIQDTLGNEIDVTNLSSTYTFTVSTNLPDNVSNNFQVRFFAAPTGNMSVTNRVWLRTRNKTIHIDKNSESKLQWFAETYWPDNSSVVSGAATYNPNRTLELKPFLDNVVDNKVTINAQLCLVAAQGILSAGSGEQAGATSDDFTNLDFDDPRCTAWNVKHDTELYNNNWTNHYEGKQYAVATWQPLAWPQGMNKNFFDDFLQGRMNPTINNPPMSFAPDITVSVKVYPLGNGVTNLLFINNAAFEVQPAAAVVGNNNVLGGRVISSTTMVTVTDVYRLLGVDTCIFPKRFVSAQGTRVKVVANISLDNGQSGFRNHQIYINVKNTTQQYFSPPSGPPSACDPLNVTSLPRSPGAVPPPQLLLAPPLGTSSRPR